MADADVEIVKRVYGLAAVAWSERETGPADLSDVFDPDVVIEENAAFPDRATYRGYEGLAKWWSGFFEVYDDVTIEPHQFTPVGDRVLVDVHHRLRSKMGVELEQDMAHVFTVRGGRVVHVTGYNDRSEALAAVLAAEG